MSEQRNETALPLDSQCAANTDREIWRRGDGDGNGMSYYEPSIHVTKAGAIGMNVGGTVVTMDVEKWHELALLHYGIKFERRRWWAFLKEPCDAPNWLFGALCVTAIFNGVWRILGG